MALQKWPNANEAINANITSGVNKTNIRDLLQRSYGIVAPILQAFLGVDLTLIFMHSP